LLANALTPLFSFIEFSQKERRVFPFSPPLFGFSMKYVEKLFGVFLFFPFYRLVTVQRSPFL